MRTLLLPCTLQHQLPIFHHQVLKSLEVVAGEIHVHIHTAHYVPMCHLIFLVHSYLDLLHETGYMWVTLPMHAQ